MCKDALLELLLQASVGSFSFVSRMINIDHRAANWSVTLRFGYAKIVHNNNDKMATFLLDLDGVIFKHSSMEFNEGALSYLKKIKAEGHSIVFTTARKSSNNNIPSLQLDLTIQKLHDAGIEFDSIVGNLSSPRVVVNDDGAFAINHDRNTPLYHQPGVELFASK
tara:strand:+ start:285 stop:779 length:495 start_codon:yes stop_codon:yes gene_type:complete